jgi:hypothetical protein
MLVQKKIKLFYIKPLPRPKNLRKGRKSASILNLKVGCGINFFLNHVKRSLCLKKLLNLKMAFNYLLWQIKISGFTTNYLKLECGLC